MKILYYCNCEKSCNKSAGCCRNGGPCSRTQDINYALNFKETPIVADNGNFIKVSDDFQEMRYEEVSKNG